MMLSVALQVLRVRCCSVEQAPPGSGWHPLVQCCSGLLHVGKVGLCVRLQLLARQLAANTGRIIRARGSVLRHWLSRLGFACCAFCKVDGVLQLSIREVGLPGGWQRCPSQSAALGSTLVQHIAGGLRQVSAVVPVANRVRHRAA